MFIAATVQHGNKLADVIAESDAALGIETTYSAPGYEIEFADYPFTDPDATFQNHLDVVKDLQPQIAVAPDIEKGLDLQDAVDQADELLQYADDVILVPKTVHPRQVPDRFLVGYPNQPKFGSQSRYGLKDFRPADRIHVLGGSPRRTIEVMHHLNVVSYDSTSVVLAAGKGKIWDAGRWRRHQFYYDYYERVRRSLDNVVRDLHRVKRREQKLLEDYQDA